MFFILSKFGISRKPAGIGIISRLVFCKAGYLITHIYNQTRIINKTDYYIFLLCLILPNLGLSTKPELGKSFPDLDFRKRLKTRDKPSTVSWFPENPGSSWFFQYPGQVKNSGFYSPTENPGKNQVKTKHGYYVQLVFIKSR